MSDALTAGEAPSTRNLRDDALDLAEYRKLVDRCARERLNRPIANGSAEHARILISRLFGEALERVVLITGHLRVRSGRDVPIYGDDEVIGNARKFLARDKSSLSIVIESGEIDGNAENAFLKAVLNDDGRRGIVELAVAGPGKLPFVAPHLMVADGAIYRFESAAAAAHDHEGITAVANFGDPETAKNLDSYFGKLLTFLQGAPGAQFRRFAAGATF